MNYLSPRLKNALEQESKTWLVTGAAGFIGSHIAEQLLNAGQRVRVLDNLSTGKIANVKMLQKLADQISKPTDSPSQISSRFTFIEGSVADISLCKEAVKGVDIIIHEAALGSVPRSLVSPLDSHESNATGQVTLLTAAKEEGVKRFVYASSSSVYGNNQDMPKIEPNLGDQLSPYAVTKRINELYSYVFNHHFGIETIGLRYFNVFGPRQHADSVYAAVIPKWINAIMSNSQTVIYGNGETSRDFTFIANVVEGTILSGLVKNPNLYGGALNLGLGGKVSLNELHQLIVSAYTKLVPGAKVLPPLKQDFRAGDILHSQASIEKAKTLLGFEPRYSVNEGIDETVKWFVEKNRVSEV